MSAKPISFEIEDVRHGWASISVRAGEATYRMDGFSYTTDAFSDLLRFGVDIALDAYTAEAMFDGEPEGWNWKFEETFDPARGFVRMFEIYEVADLMDANSPRRQVLAVMVERDQVASALLEAVRAVTERMTIEGFERAWLQAYPVRGISALEVALATVRRPRPDPGPPVAVVRIRGAKDE